MFAVDTTLEEIKTATITSHLCLRKTWSGRSHDCHDYCDAIIFKMLHFHNVFCASPHKNEKLGLPNSSGWKSVFEKLCFMTHQSGQQLGLPVEIKLCVQISPASGMWKLPQCPLQTLVLDQITTSVSIQKELKPHVQCALFKQFL